MKKLLTLSLVVCLLMSLSGCQAARVPGLDWNPEEMVELHLYQGAVPADAHRKITRDRETIQLVARALFSLRVERGRALWRDWHLFCLLPGGSLPGGGAPWQQQGTALHRGGLLQAAQGIPPEPGRPVELHRRGVRMGGREQAPGNRQLPRPRSGMKSEKVFAVRPRTYLPSFKRLAEPAGETSVSRSYWHPG